MPQLTSKDGIRDFVFWVDITTHLNMLASSLQGRSQMVTQMYDSVRSFLAKLCLWASHLARNNLAHFRTLKLVSENEKDGLNYLPQIKVLKTEFQKRFWLQTLGERTNAVQLPLLREYQSSEWRLANGSDSIAVQPPTESEGWDVGRRPPSSAGILGMVTLNRKTSMQGFCPCLETIMFGSSCFLPWNEIKYCSR